MIKYILIGGFICLVLVIIFALLKVASDFDDEAEGFFHSSFYKNDGLNENTYKDIIDEHEDKNI